MTDPDPQAMPDDGTGVKTWIQTLTSEQKQRLEQRLRIKTAREDDGPDGFAAFYHLIYDRPLPEHARLEWVPLIYAARRHGKGALIEAFRGAAKSSTLSVAWVAFRIGHRPETANLVIQVSDAAARDTCKQIADLIAHHAGWQEVFPQIVPDHNAGWGLQGYTVMREDLPYPEWRAKAAASKGKDPTLLGVGYKSRSVIGKHPNGVLLIDDIHDENNTRSARELEMVRQVFTGTILPTITAETWQVVVGTPWVGDDILAYLKATGRYLSTKTPVMRGEEPVWPERFPREEIERRRQESGTIEFARMYLLDLAAAVGAYLRREWLTRYPLKQIHPDWPVIMGVDYASTADQLNTGQRDFFAVAIGRALPGGAGMVLVDGFRGHVSQGEAVMRLIGLAEQYPTLEIIGVEAQGKGEEFYHLMLRSSYLPIEPTHTGRASKGERFEKRMAPLFEYHRAWLSDVETPFLRAFEQEWVSWPHGRHDDTLDAVYWMLKVGAPHLMQPTRTAARPKNPFAGLGRQ